MTEFAWLIEAPGQHYLSARTIGCSSDFYWTRDPLKATRFVSCEQADAVMMAVRQAVPTIWMFAMNLGDARPTEHGWLAPLSAPDPLAQQLGEEG